MNSMFQFPVIPLLVVFATMSLTLALYRLSSLNTFVDHRKNALRGTFREICEVYPDLLLLIHNIGKTGAPTRELAIFERIHLSVALLSSGIHGLRERYNKLHRYLTILLQLLNVSGVLIAVFFYDSPLEYVGVFWFFFAGWMFFAWDLLRLKLPKGLRALELLEMLSRLEQDADAIAKLAEGRRLKLIRDVSVV